MNTFFNEAMHFIISFPCCEPNLIMYEEYDYLPYMLDKRVLICYGLIWYK